MTHSIVAVTRQPRMPARKLCRVAHRNERQAAMKRRKLGDASRRTGSLCETTVVES
jgi:hypothetical protein